MAERRLDTGGVQKKKKKPEEIERATVGNQAFFGEQIPSLLKKPGLPGVKLETSAEIEARKQMTPEQKFEQLQEQSFQKGLTTGTFENLSEQEVTARLKAQGKQVAEPPAQPLESRPLAEFGVSIPVAAANFISRALKPFGVDMGTITPREFANTDIGLFLGLSITAVEAYGLASYGASLLGAGGVKALIGGNIVKSGIGMKGALGLVGGGILGHKLISLPEKALTDSRQAMAGTLQTASLINEGLKIGALSPSEAILAYRELDNQFYELEKSIKFQAKNPLNWLKSKDTLVDIANARTQLELSIRGMQNILVQSQNI